MASNRMHVYIYGCMTFLNSILANPTVCSASALLQVRRISHLTLRIEIVTSTHSSHYQSCQTFPPQIISISFSLTTFHPVYYAKILGSSIIVSLTFYSHSSSLPLFIHISNQSIRRSYLLEECILMPPIPLSLLQPPQFKLATSLTWIKDFLTGLPSAFPLVPLQFVLYNKVNSFWNIKQLSLCFYYKIINGFELQL